MTEREVYKHGRVFVTGQPLSRREREVAALVAQGLRNKDIAARLCISLQTLKNHITAALVKAGAQTRTELAVWWLGRER